MNFVTSRYLAFSDTFEENEIYKRIIYLIFVDFFILFVYNKYRK